jgi:hypothetical protein
VSYAALACRGLIGLVFAVAVAGKVRGPAAYREFASWLAALPVPLARNRALPAILVAAEAAIVLLVAVPVGPAAATAGLALAAACLAVMTAGTVAIVRRGARVSCRCFGASQTPLGARHLVRDAILLITAVTGTVCSAFAAEHDVVSPAGIALSLAFALVAATFLVFIDDVLALVGPGPTTSEEAG